MKCLSHAWQRPIQSGYPRAKDISSGVETGFGPSDLTIVNGIRQSAADAYLLPALQRPNLDFVGEAIVQPSLVENGRCIGIEYRDGSGQARHRPGRMVRSCWPQAASDRPIC